MNVDKLRYIKIKCLINVQLECLDNLLEEKALPIQYNTNKAEFFKVSLEIQKQISKLKKERF